MYMMNHNNDQSTYAGSSCRQPQPYRSALDLANSANGVAGALINIMQHANKCEGKFKKYPTVVWLNSINLPEPIKLPLLPDIDIGPFVAQGEMNGL